MGATEVQVIKGPAIPCHCCKMLLVVRNDQSGAEVHKVLYTLLAAWGQLAQSTPTPDCVHHSNGSLAHRLY